MDIYTTLYMLAAIRVVPPEHTFFKRRYFPTNQAMDIFGTSKVLADFKEEKLRAADFVLPRLGPISIGREGFSTYELEPGNISISRPLTIDQLNRRGFGESLLSTATPADRARMLLMGDLEELNKRITRTEEKLAIDTMLTNGATMRHYAGDPDLYEDVKVQFYDGDSNPCKYTIAETWKHSEYKSNGWIIGNWYYDIAKMAKTVTRRGNPATEVLISSDVADFLLEDPWVIAMMDNRRIDLGTLDPTELTDYVYELGSFNFLGKRLRILVNDGSYVNKAGEDTPYIPDGTVIVTAPNCGKGLYGAVTQLESDGQYHTYAGARVPQHVFTMIPPMKETVLTSRPLFVPVAPNPWMVAEKVLTNP